MKVLYSSASFGCDEKRGRKEELHSVKNDIGRI